MAVPVVSSLRSRLARIRFEARGGITKPERRLCNLLHNGDLAAAQDALIPALAVDGWRSAAAFDTAVRVAHALTVDHGLSPTAAVIDAVERHIQWRQRSSHRAHDGSLAMWLAVLEHVGETPQRWRPSRRVRVIAASIGARSVDGTFAQAVASIRFAPAHEWLVGEPRRLPRSLWPEMRLWYRWLQLTRAEDLLWHVDHAMPLAETSRQPLVVSGGDPQHSNVALLHHPAAVGSSAPLGTLATIEHTALYFLHFSFPWDSQGYVTRSHGLLRAINRSGWTVTGATRSGYPFDVRHGVTDEAGSATFEQDGIEYLRLGRRGPRANNLELASYLNEYADRAAALIEDRRPAVVHAASSAWNGIAAAQAASRYGLPVVYEVRGLWELTQASKGPVRPLATALATRLETHAAMLADHVFTITAALRDEFIARGVDAERISVLPNAVDVDRFVPRDRDGQLAAELGLTGKTVIGYVGSLVGYEGLELLLAAVALLRDRVHDFHVLIVGGSDDECAHVQATAAQFGVSHLVTLTGRVAHAEVEHYYSCIDIAAFPRLPLPVCEIVSPLKPFEAMAMEKACVVSSVAALAEIIEDDHTGLIFEKGSAPALADALQRLLTDAPLRARLGTNARAWVARERTWDAVGAEVARVYERLVRG